MITNPKPIIIVGEGRAKGKGQRGKIKNYDDFFNLHSNLAHSKLPSQKRFQHDHRAVLVSTCQIRHFEPLEKRFTP